MKSVLELNGSSVEVSTFLEEVSLEVEDGVDTVSLFLTPGKAVQLSRALVAAAAEALGVAV